jgi:hypothetical protein
MGLQEGFLCLAGPAGQVQLAKLAGSSATVVKSMSITERPAQSQPDHIKCSRSCFIHSSIHVTPVAYAHLSIASPFQNSSAHSSQALQHRQGLTQCPQGMPCRACQAGMKLDWSSIFVDFEFVPFLIIVLSLTLCAWPCMHAAAMNMHVETGRKSPG